MNLSRPPRTQLLSILSLLVVLTTFPARADSAHETIYLPRAEISDEALRGVIGIAFINSMTGPDQHPSGKIPRFRPKGESFEPDGTLGLKNLRALSGWDYDGMALRKFPVIERRGHYLHVIIDVHTSERAWISERKQANGVPGVEFRSFEAKQWEWSGVDFYHLAPKGQSRLYMAPKLEARSHPLSPDFPPRWNGQLADVFIMTIRGNFLQFGAMIDLDQPLQPLGWLPIHDENGLLLIWPIAVDLC